MLEAPSIEELYDIMEEYDDEQEKDTLSRLPISYRKRVTISLITRQSSQ